MKLTIQQPTEIEADAIRCVLPVNYGDEDMPADYPHRRNDLWDITIDLASGLIHDWPVVTSPLDLHMKVVDGGSYYLMGLGQQVGAIINDYVPNCLPGEYGDYVHFRIDETGRITNWRCDPAKVQAAFFGERD